MKSFQFRTEVAPKPSDWKINHHTEILTLGSCFAEVLGSQLEAYKFRVLSNPFGTVFNPYSMANLLTMVVENRAPNPHLYLATPDGICLHHDFHSSLWAPSREALQQLLTQRLEAVRAQLARAQVLVLTFGTAHAYRHKGTLAVVSNCHKVPQPQFIKELLSVEQIVRMWEKLIRALRLDLKIVLTVSPVRHTRDTIPLNQVSKSILRVACHALSQTFPNVTYFPSYEIMVDELRDYRYYEPDMIHPTPLAEAYIFRTFAQTYLDEASQRWLEEWDAIQKMRQHRPQHGFTESYRSLLLQLRQRLHQLPATVEVQAELGEVNQQLANFPVRS
ncbi:GSCFA domain-containing protein [Rhabdobacter roseus]|uniref:Lysophospholipase L1-like esterase n=1 Tax=Rhabdobacter roseus TaxID=1655419 RepID=A0A840TRG6_9BACT|nr:GSCFA domain-containing protein [Rhabdobacter roseus]MBB5286501.1 lysophospholipase L1-like esterase [Rhabdobacter roseus]